MKTLLTIFLLLPLTTIVQGAASKHTFRIVFFDAPRGAPSTLHLFDGKETQEVKLPKMNFSPVYTLPPGPLNLRLLPAPLNDPQKVPAGAPAVQVSENMVDFYLLVTSDPTNKVAPVRMQVIDAGADKLKRGQMLWFNLSPNTVGGTLGTEKLLIEPGKREVINPPVSGHKDYPVSIGFQIPGDKHVHPLCDSRWRHDPRSRTIVFIHSIPGRVVPNITSFLDFRPS